jgi:hypothetical protein
MRGRPLILLAALAVAFLFALGTGSAAAAFGIVNFDGETTANAAGDPATQAGSHPFATTTEMQFTANEGTGLPEASFKDLVVELPPGLTGNPNAVPKCSLAEFAGGLGLGAAACSDSTAIGVSTLESPLFGVLSAPVYNLDPAPGEPARFGFKVLTAEIFLDASIRTGGDYGTTITISNSSQGLPVIGTSLTLWGVPADPSHDEERGSCLQLFGGPNGELCPSEAPVRPFLSMPTSCSGPLATTLHANAWGEPEFKTASFQSHDSADNPVGVDGCDRLSFTPFVTTDVGNAADSPTALGVDVHVPQSNEDPDGLVASHLKTSAVTLPVGMAINPAAAGGLVACSQAQFGLNDDSPVTCPDASKLGSAEIVSPLLATPLTGSIYFAEQRNNPFGSELAIYVVTVAEGVAIKLAGQVEPDPATGQLRTVFDDNPQLPFDDLKLNFFGGPQATFRTPSACGTYATAAAFTPWSGGAAVDSSDSFAIDRGPDGSPCPAGALGLGGFAAATTNPVAGDYSPFVVSVQRNDGSQPLTGIALTLPPGLLAKIAGIPYCPDAQIAAAAARAGEGQGATELAAPSCPSASLVGTVAVTVGSGPAPFRVGTGRVYLAGPYRGAPLSLAIVVPAVTGPLDLGNVVVRAAVDVNSETAQVHAVADPLPTILHGIPIDVRGVFLDLDRSRFTLNPTDCSPMSVTGVIGGAAGASVPVSDRFQVGSCGDLSFRPKLTLRLSGKTRRTGHPKLRAVLKMPAGGANIRRASVTLPPSEILDQGHIGTACTRVQFAARRCPANSVYGSATARTPLLDQPLRGPVFLRSSNHRLPDLVADLRGQIDITVVARIGSRHGGLRSVFEAVPDAPVSSFTLRMKGGRKGLLQNTTNICRGVHRARVKFTGHNGRVREIRPRLTNGRCKG